MEDRIAVTYEDYNFQIEMFFNGIIRISYLYVFISDSIAGLSEGNGIPEGFTESDLSAYDPCPPANTLAVNIPESATEGDAVLTNQGMVTLEHEAEKHLIVELASDDISEVIVPAAILILAGQSSASFDLIIADDAAYDGIRGASITARAEDCASGSDMILVFDRDVTDLPGDVDYSKTVELRDAMLALKTACGAYPSDIYFGADADGDGKIGVAEAAYILELIAE